MIISPLPAYRKILINLPSPDVVNVGSECRATKKKLAQLVFNEGGHSLAAQSHLSTLPPEQSYSAHCPLDSHTVHTAHFTLHTSHCSFLIGFLIKFIYFYKIEYIIMVLLYMWKKYELV